MKNVKKLKVLLGALGLSSYVLVGCSREKESDDINQILYQVENLKQENLQLKEQSENKTQKQSEAILEPEKADEIQEQSEDIPKQEKTDEAQEYKASNLYVVEVDNHICILECCYKRFSLNGASNLAEEIEKLCYNAQEVAQKVALYRDKYGIIVNDYEYKSLCASFKSVFQNADNLPCCSFVGNVWNYTLQQTEQNINTDTSNENTNIDMDNGNININTGNENINIDTSNKNENNYISYGTYSFYYKIDGGATYHHYENYPIGEIHYHVYDEKFKEIAKKQLDYITGYSEFTVTQPDESVSSWDGYMSLKAFTEVFNCNPDDTFTLEELSEMLQELGTSQKRYHLHI